MLTAALGAVALLLAVPVLLQVAAVAAPRKRRPPQPPPELPRLLFIIPAHDEEVLIGDCVTSLVGMDYPATHRRVIVVADNCIDRTAAIARERGAECLERHAPALPGKPHALAWAVAQLTSTPWDACVIIDADTIVDAGFGHALARLGPLDHVAAQAYFGTLNETSSWLTRLAGVFARGRYEVTYRLKARAGLNCPLTGNGMCLGRALLVPGGWRWFSLTEDLELYADLTTAGVPILFAGEARLHSMEAVSLRQGWTQRQRWLTGRIHVLRRWAGRVISSRHISPLQKLDALTELAGPSPAPLLLASLATASLALALLTPPASWLVAVIALSALASHVLTTFVVLVRHPDPWRTLAAFAMLLPYAVWRAVMAVGTLAVSRRLTWRRTDRG